MPSTTRDLKRRYAQMLETVGAAVRAFDPFGLIASGAPSGEFDDEIARFAAAAIEPKSAEAFASEIARILNERFDGDLTAESCLLLAREIHSELKRKGLLAPPRGDSES